MGYKCTMSKKSIIKNTIYYILYNVFNMLFPLVSGIYVARVLSPKSIGEVSYAQNIVTYFVILAFLGIPTYGIREIANARNNKEELNKIFSELFIINFISTMFFFIVYFIFIFNNYTFKSTIKLNSIMGILIFFNIFNIDWLYEGLEEFKFISIRNTVFKTFSILLLVTLVRQEEDYIKYALVIIFGTVGNYISNIIYSKKFIKLTFKGLNFKRHFKSIVHLIMVNLAIEIYTLVDVSMLGFFCSKAIVAFYVYGSRVYRILLQVINAITMVVVPRLSLLHFEKKEEDFNQLLSNCFKILLLIGIPMFIGIQFTGEKLVILIYGEKYIPSVIIIKIMSVLLIFTPIGYLLGSRVLLISKKEKKMVIAVSIGAITNAIGNYILIQKYDELGATISTTISEILVMLVYIYLGKNYFKIFVPKREILKVLLANVLLLCLLYFIEILNIRNNMKLGLEILISIPFYFGILVFLKEQLIYNEISKFKRRIFK